MELRRRALFAFAFVLFAASVFGNSTSAKASDEGAGAFVDRLGNKTISYLSNASATQEWREDRLRELFREGFATDRIGRFVLGKYRRNASDTAVNEFVQVFEDYIVAFYAKQFQKFSGETFTVQKVIEAQANKVNKDSMVMAKLVPATANGPLRVTFQVRKVGDDFKILDIRVEGVSLVLAQRDEFTTYIGNNGGKVESLTSALRQRLSGLASSAPSK